VLSGQKGVFEEIRPEGLYCVEGSALWMMKTLLFKLRTEEKITQAMRSEMIQVVKFVLDHAMPTCEEHAKSKDDL
jgi:hypothetical protein